MVGVGDGGVGNGGNEYMLSKGKKASRQCKFLLPRLPHIFNFVEEKEENLWSQLFWFLPCDHSIAYMDCQIRDGLIKGY